MNVPKEVIADIERLGIENAALKITFEAVDKSNGERAGCIVETILIGFEILPELQHPGN
jgi:hypothetical protein